MGSLVEPGQLTSYRRQRVRADSEETAIRVADGWLRGATSRLSEWPAPGTADHAILWSWAMELTAIAYDNPDNLYTRTADDETKVYEARLRRREILDAARKKYGGSVPMFHFPEPCE